MGGTELSNLTGIVIPTVDVPGARPAAARLSFGGSRPNPMRNSGMLAFDLPRAGAVALDLFDARGRLVRRVLADEWRPAGPQSVRLERGTLPAGLYLVRLSSGDTHATAKVVFAN